MATPEHERGVAAERERWVAACNAVADGAVAARRPGAQTVAQVFKLAIEGESSKPYPVYCRDCLHSQPEPLCPWNLRCMHPKVNAKDEHSLAGNDFCRGSSTVIERKRIFMASCGRAGKLWERKT